MKKVEVIEKNYKDIQSEKDTSITISSSHEFRSEKYLYKITAPYYLSIFFQEIKDFEHDLNIKEIISWYSNLDEQTKIGITSFNNRELVRLICNNLIIYNYIKSKSPPKKELKPENKKPKTSINNNNNNPTEELIQQFEEDKGKEKEKEDLYEENNEYQNLENNEETTTKPDTENEKEQFKKEDFLKYTKICSLKDNADTLIFNIESKELEECLNYFPKKESTIKPIIPKIIDNEWNITLPDSKMLKTLSFCQIIPIIFILLHFEYYVSTEKAYEMPFLEELREFFKDNKLIKKELLNNKVDVTNDIFNLNNSSFIVQKCSYNYIKKYSTEDQEFSSEQVYKCFKNIFKNLKKKFFSELKANEEKLKILSEKISYYTFEDLINSEQFIYSEIRNDLKLNQNIDDFYMNINNNTEKLKEIKNIYLEKTKNILKAILGQKIDIIDYGSYATDLSTEFSDMDILLFDEEIKDEIQYGNNLINKLNEKKNLLNINNISPLKNNNLITISYDVSKEKVLNEINFSLKYLDDNKVDLNNINIDITFTNDKIKVEKAKENIKIIKNSIKKYKQLRPVILYLKTFFRTQKAYQIYKGGINSISLYCLARNILVTYEKNHFNVNSFSNGLILFYISEKFGHYHYLFGIDKDGNDYPLNSQEKGKGNPRFVIKNPVDNKNNVASGFHEPNKIIEKFSLLFNHIKEGKDILLPLQKYYNPKNKKFV